MKLTKSRKIAIGVLTVWPILYIFIFMFYTLAGHFLEGSQGWRGRLFPIISVLHHFTIFWIVPLIVFYLYYLFKTDKVPKNEKALWAAVIIVGNMLTMPVFWFLYIWKDPKTSNS